MITSLWLPTSRNEWLWFCWLRDEPSTFGSLTCVSLVPLLFRFSPFLLKFSSTKSLEIDVRLFQFREQESWLWPYLCDLGYIRNTSCDWQDEGPWRTVAEGNNYYSLSSATSASHCLSCTHGLVILLTGTDYVLSPFSLYGIDFSYLPHLVWIADSQAACMYNHNVTSELTQNLCNCILLSLG